MTERGGAELSGARAVMVTYQDNAGVSRIKVVPASRLPAVAVNGCTASLSAAALFSTDDYPVSTPALDAVVGDLRAMPDLAAAAPLDTDAGLWWAPANLHQLDGSPFAGCQRALLQRVAGDLAAHGLDASVGMELEFTLFAGSKDDPRPAHTGPGYGTLAFVELEAFGLDVLDGLATAGVPVEQLHPEYAKGQIEVSLGPADAVTAVDQYLLARVAITRVALAHGYLASFAPIAIAGEVGNGLHIHLSATRDGANVFHEPGADHGISATGGQMIAGVLDQLVDATALLTGSTISFQRLQPHTWSGAFACWGDGNREAAIRLMRGFGASAAKQANIEVKCADATSNQYLAVAAVLASALHGVTERLALPAAVGVDPASLTDDERAAAGVRPLPATLSDALGALAASAFFRALLGDVLFDAYVAVRRHDHEVFGPLADDPEALVASARWRQ